MSDFKLSVKNRNRFGHRQAKSAMSDSIIFGNVYGHGMESIAVEGDYRDVIKIIRQAGKSRPLELTISEKEKFNCLVGEVDLDPLTQRMRHVGFRVVKRDEKVTTDVPIHFIGEPPALRRGLIMVTVTDHLSVEATPENIPEFIQVDTSILEEDDQAIRIQDLDLLDSYKVLDEVENVIVKVELPKEEIIEEPEVEEEVEGGEAGEAGEEEAAEKPTENEAADQ